MPLQDLDRDGLAEWYARRHLKTDDAISKVFYLPEGAPQGEIRFIEVNSLISELTPMEPIDFGVDVDGINTHALVVLDVTPTQWESIRSGSLQPPSGWNLNNSTEFERPVR